MKQKVAGGGRGGGVHINHKKALNNSKASYIAKIKAIYSSLFNIKKYSKNYLQCNV